MITGTDPTGCERCDRCRPLDARGLCERCADIVDQREQRGRTREAREQQTQRDLETAREAAAIAGPEIRTDGGETDSHATRVNEQLRMADDTDMTDDTDIKPGDVALDLAQGRPVHVLEDTGQTALEWINENGYDLLDNYANSRFGATDADRVFDVVYCSSVKSEPSKTYAFPDSRLMRIETDAADGGRPVYGRIVVDVLEELFKRAAEDDQDAVDVLENYAGDVGFGDEASEARELAEAARFGGGSDE